MTYFLKNYDGVLLMLIAGGVTILIKSVVHIYIRGFYIRHNRFLRQRINGCAIWCANMKLHIR